MMIDHEFVSPDGQLRFFVQSLEGDDLMLGFQDMPWHTHADLLPPASSGMPEDATLQFVEAIIAGKWVVVITRVAGEIRDIGLTLDPSDDLLYCGPDETLEFRLWDGSKVGPKELETEPRDQV